MSAPPVEEVARPAWLPEALFPFRLRALAIDGCRVHYIDEGAGPVLLFLHGNPTYSLLYRGIVRRLRGKFRCIALDYPGFGLSTAREGYDFRPESHAAIVEKFLLAHDLRDVTLMVQDWGGPIGMSVAGRHPDRFRAFVIGNTWAWPPDAGKTRFSKIMGGPVGGFLILNFNFFVKVVLARAGLKRVRLSPEVKAAYAAPFPTRASRKPMHVFPREIVASSDWLAGVEASLKRLADKPVLLVWGDQDPAFRQHDLERWQEKFPHKKTVMLSGASHYIQEEAPEEIATAIEEWQKTI